MKKEIVEKNSPVEPTDHELMLQVQQNDEKAFEILMRRHEDAVFRLANRIIGDIEEARDVAQEVFIRIWENPHTWKPTAAFTTWLYRVTMNRSLNRQRTLKVKSLFRISDIRQEEEPRTDDTPDSDLVRNEQQALFDKQFNLLPARQRAALHLRYREQLPVKDIAAAIGASVKSVESLLFRAKRTLRTPLKNE